MKGFLTQLFLCGTLYLAEGHFYNRPREQDHYHESGPHVYRGDWIPFREGMILQRGQDMSDVGEGSLRTFRKPVWERHLIFPADDTEDSGEDRSPSVVSDAGFRHSSATNGLGATFRRPVNVIPDYQLVISSRSNPNQDFCFIRRVIALSHLMVANTYDQAVSINGAKASSPKILRIMVRELTENLDSVPEIEDLDKELLKHVKVFRVFFRLLRRTFVEHSGESPEMSLALAFFTQVELLLQDFLDLAEEDSRAKAPGIRLLLDAMDTILTDLTEEEEAPWKKYITHLPEIQRFVDDARAALEALFKGLSNLRKKSQIKASDLREVLINIENTLKEVIDDYSLFDTDRPGSADHFLRQLVIEFQKGISRFLEDSSFQ